MKQIPMTDDIRLALDAVARAERVFVPGFDSASVIELPKLALSDAVCRAVGARQPLAVPRPRAAKVVRVAPASRRRRA